MTTDGQTWYIIHPTGKKECGGTFVTNSNSTQKLITLPISFSNTDYICLLTPKNLGANQSIGSAKRITGTITNNSFNVLGSFVNAGDDGYVAVTSFYYCCGY